VEPDSGTVRLAGQPLATRGPRDTLRAGISAVYQELSLVDDFSVLDNLVLGVEPRRFGLRDRQPFSMSLNWAPLGRSSSHILSTVE
jgi:ribose transport system ATP-binding protein